MSRGIARPLLAAALACASVLMLVTPASATDLEIGDVRMPRYNVVGAVSAQPASVRAVERAVCRVPGERQHLFPRSSTTWFYPTLGAWRERDCTVTANSDSTIKVSFGPLLAAKSNREESYSVSSFGPDPHLGVARFSATNDCSTVAAQDTQFQFSGNEFGLGSVPITESRKGQYLCVAQVAWLEVKSKVVECELLCLQMKSVGSIFSLARGPWSVYRISTQGPQIADIASSAQSGLLGREVAFTVTVTGTGHPSFVSPPRASTALAAREARFVLTHPSRTLEYRLTTDVLTCPNLEVRAIARCTQTPISLVGPLAVPQGDQRRVIGGTAVAPAATAVAGRAGWYAVVRSTLEGRVAVDGADAPWHALAREFSPAVRIQRAPASAAVSASPAPSAAVTPSASASATPSASPSATPAGTPTPTASATQSAAPVARLAVTAASAPTIDGAISPGSRIPLTQARFTVVNGTSSPVSIKVVTRAYFCDTAAQASRPTSCMGGSIINETSARAVAAGATSSMGGSSGTAGAVPAGTLGMFGVLQSTAVNTATNQALASSASAAVRVTSG